VFLLLSRSRQHEASALFDYARRLAEECLAWIFPGERVLHVHRSLNFIINASSSSATMAIRFYLISRKTLAVASPSSSLCLLAGEEKVFFYRL
jgi:hypothetical protein